MRKLLVILLVMVAFAACDSTPDYVIPPKKMAELMADVHTGEAVVESNSRTFSNDSLKRTFMQSIYMKHGVTSAQVDTSLYWYGNNLTKYSEMYKLTIEILKERIANAERAGGKAENAPINVSLDGDSVNVWQGISTLRVNPYMPSKYLTFHTNSDKNWDRGDRYTMNIKTIGNRSPISLRLAVEYNDGTTEYVTSTQVGEGTKHLTLVLDSAKVASTVFGSIYYSPRGDEVSYLDSISVVRTRGRNDNVKAREGQHLIHHR